MKLKRLLAMLMVGVMVAGMSTIAFAEEGAEPEGSTYEPTNAYALNYESGDDKWQYFSPYWAAFDTGYNNALISFTLKKISNPGEHFAVYCTDLYTGLNYGAQYRRMNLEDCTYYAPGVAGKLRSVVLNGLPYAGTNAAAAVAAISEATGVAGLTIGEAVSATQIAIWETAHGELAEVTDFCSYIDTEWDKNATEYYEDCYKEITDGYAAAKNEELIESHIQTVYEYLISLEPTAPIEETVSDSSISGLNVAGTANEDGSYDVTVTASIDVEMAEEDALAWTAILGDASKYIASDALKDGVNTVTYTFENVPADVADDAVTLAIDGNQTVADVYFFDAIGVRGTSQSLIGYMDTQLPVHAEVSTNDRVLEIFKTENDGTTALKNITFDIYYVCSLEKYINGDENGEVIGTGKTTVDGKDYFSVPTKNDISNYVTYDVPVASITTGDNGVAMYNFGTDSDGIYIVVERENAVTTGAVAPFFVAIPGGAYADGSHVEEGESPYVVKVQPKNTIIEEKVEIEKDVTDIDNDRSSYDVGENHTWIIQSSIPAGLGTGLKYEVSDTLDEKLTFVSVDKLTVAYDNGIFGVETEEQIAAKTEDAVGEEGLELIKNVDYTVKVTEATETTTDKFVVALTSAGMEKVAEYVAAEIKEDETDEKKLADYEIRVYFTAKINENAVMGENIPNQARVDYENNVGSEYEAESDIPVVYTCGINIFKHDAKTEAPLANAKFKIARVVGEGETPDSTLVTKEGTPLNVVYEYFHDDATLIGDKVNELTTDEYGAGVIYGLKEGTYYLVETQAPNGYNLLRYPVAVNLDETSHVTEDVATTDANEDRTVYVANSNAFQLPSTGGMGTTIFTVSGITLMAAAFVMLVMKKKENE